ncbi:MAG: hypothetical protein Q8L78_02285 [Coxiellaceae bacterium]|nr:hypothetical protein [Coxiellaceae bacterium]
MKLLTWLEIQQNNFQPGQPGFEAIRRLQKQLQKDFTAAQLENTMISDTGSVKDKASDIGELNEFMRSSYFVFKLAEPYVDVFDREKAKKLPSFISASYEQMMSDYSNLCDAVGLPKKSQAVTQDTLFQPPKPVPALEEEMKLARQLSPKPENKEKERGCDNCGEAHPGMCIKPPRKPK